MRPRSSDAPAGAAAHGADAHRPLSGAEHAENRALLRDGSRSFHVASWVLPESVRAPATALYAFCRLADDAVDRSDTPLVGLARLRERLERAYAGQPLPLAADRAFAEVVATHAIPKALPAALLEGFEWDVRGRRYETLADLHAYAVRVAGSVGAMMALVMGVREPALVARACDLGVAMQLTNVARDVGEDARAGRLYLPRAWLREAGLDPDAWLAAPTFSPALAGVLRRLLARADELYALADAGIALLPADCRTGIRAARLLYAEIGRELERRGLDSVTRRAVVPWPRKAAALVAALAGGRADAAAAHAVPVLAEARFVVDAVHASPAPRLAPPARGFEERLVWTLELFARLEQRQPGGAGSS